jgi:hypothetical protein
MELFLLMKSSSTFPSLQYFGGKGACWSFGMGTKTNDKQVNYSHKPNKPNNKLVSAWLTHFWCMDEPHAYTDSRDSTWFELGRSHHLPSYSTFCVWPWGLHPNVILSHDSQVGNLEILEIRTPATLKAHNFLCRPTIEARLIFFCNLCQELSNDMWHTTYANKSRRFLTFSGRESNWQFDFRPFFRS